MKKILLLSLVSIFSIQLFGTVRYVKPDEASTAWSGEVDVYTSIHDAYAAAVTDDEIWVSAGVYAFASTITGTKTVSFYGGFVGTESDISQRQIGPSQKSWDFVNETIVEPEAAFTSQRLFTLPNASTPYVVDGFVFRKAINYSLIEIKNNGTLQNCILRECDGGGQIFRVYGAATIKDCYVHDNTISTQDGTVLVQGTSAEAIARAINVVIRNNTNNASTNAIGGIYSGGFAQIINCEISGTKAAGAHKWGTAILTASANNPVEVIQCLIYNNGGVPLSVKNTSFINCTVTKNEGVGNTVINLPGTGNTFYNTLLVGNTNNSVPAMPFGTPGNGSYYNMGCDFDLSSYDDAFTLVTFDNVQFITPTSFVGAATDSNQEAEFENANWNVEDLSSPIIDKGNKLNFPGNMVTDFAGNSRMSGNEIDLGAYEVQVTTVSVENDEILNNYFKLLVNNNNIIISAEKEGLAEVFNIQGKMISKNVIHHGENVIPVYFSGIYVVKVTVNNKISVYKIVL